MGAEALESCNRSLSPRNRYVRDQVVDDVGNRCGHREVHFLLVPNRTDAGDGLSGCVEHKDHGHTGLNRGGLAGEAFHVVHAERIEALAADPERLALVLDGAVNVGAVSGVRPPVAYGPSGAALSLRRTSHHHRFRVHSGSTVIFEVRETCLKILI